MGAENPVGSATLAPWRLWTGILAGPAVWTIDLLVSYGSVKWVCNGQHPILMNVFSVCALAVIAWGASFSWQALQATPDVPTDEGTPLARARFMALLGLAMSAFLALLVIAGTIPRWMVDGCR